MTKADILLKTINDAFEKLTMEVDDQSDLYKVLFDPEGPPQVDRKRPGKGGTKFTYAEISKID